MTADRTTLSRDGRIESWKAIGAFLGRDERTVQRWEKERRLPVHRLPGERGIVFAYKRELLQWLHTSPSASHAPRIRVPLPSADGRSIENKPALGSVHPPKQPCTGEVLSDPTRQARASRWLFWMAAGAFALLLFLADNYHARVQAAPHSGPGAAVDLPGMAAAHVAGNVALDRQEAREFYLQGRYHLNRRTSDSLERARDEFIQAIVHDANCAEAYAGLAETYELMPQYSPVPLHDAFPRGVAAARRAVALDPTSAEAHRVLGFGLFYGEWKVRPAFAELHRAMELDPEDAEAHHWYATALLTLRRTAEAKSEIARARELNPASRAIRADQLLINFAAGGDLGECLARLREMQRTEPEFMSPPRYIGQILLQRDDFPAWISALHEAADHSGASADRGLATAAERGWQRSGKHGLFLEVRRAQQQAFDAGLSTGYDLGLTCLRLGDKEAAVHYLQAAFAAGDFRLLSLIHDPADAALRGYAPYDALRQAVESRAANT